MPMTVSELQVKVTADTSAAESGLAGLGSKVGSVGSSIATAFGGVAIAGVAALGAGLVASTAAAAGFESQMSAVKAVSGATADEMKGLSDLALQLGADTSFSASEAAQGIGELVKAGVSIADVMGGGAAAALSLAAAGGVEVAEAAEIASNAMNVFSLKGADVGHVADVIAGAANASAIDVHDFGMSLAASGAVAATVGIGFDDLGTAIAVMGQAGIKGSDAGTSLKTMLLNLTPSTKSQIAVARELGIVTDEGGNKFFDAAGKAKSLSEIAGVLQTATAGLTEQQKLQALQTLFGTDAIRAAAIMAKAGAEGFDEMAASIGKVTAADVAKERLDNLKGSLEQLGGSLETAGIMLGTMLLPGLKGMVDGLTEGVNKGIEIIKQLPGAWEDVKTIFSEGATSGNFEKLLSGLGLSEAMVVQADEWLARIGDAWRTMKQAFAGDWRPSDQIDPFVNSVGIAATKLRELRDVVVDAFDKAGRMGAWDNLKGAFSTLGDTVKLARDRFNDIGTAFDRAMGSSKGALTASDLLAISIKALGVGFQLTALQVAGLVDNVLTGIAVTIDFGTAASRVGDAMQRLGRGDVQGATTALGEAKEAFAAGATAAEGLRTRGLDRAAEGAKILSDAVKTHIPPTTKTIESNMDAAQARVAEGSAGMQQFMETNMAGVMSAAEAGMTGVATATETGMAQTVGAVEGAVPAATAAGDALGQGIASGVETAIPAAEAAGAAAGQAAADGVSSQSGTASSAGQSLGEALGSGLEGGILAYAGRVAAAAGRMVSQAIGAANAEADAHSPSKKTEQLGKDLAEGLEIGLNSSSIGEDMKRKIRDFIQASREYIPTAREIARVEGEIKTIREQSQTDALFRAEKMITLDSETLRLRENMARLDRDSLDLRQDLAAATRDIADAERGTLAQRTETIEIDAKRKAIRLETLDLEKQLLTVHKNSDRTEFIKRQIDALRDQDRLLGIEAERITTTQSLSTTAARIRREQIDDQVRGYDSIIQVIKNQIDKLGAERGVFEANENVIKNATQNEIDYRNRLIAVFTEEGKPLAARIAAGKALLEQLHSEGKISDELYNAVKKVTDQEKLASGSTQSLGTASAIAAPQIGAAASQADRMAQEAADMARQTAEAARKVDALSSSLGRLPSWFTPTGGGGGNQGLFHFASGGRPPVGIPSIVGERGPELFVPDRSGTILPADTTRSWMGGSSAGPVQTHRVALEINGQAAADLYVTGREVAIRYGRATS